jgi:prevent-host-death family protein
MGPRISVGRGFMETISVGELKARFSEVLDRVQKGEEIIISYGKRREKVAVLLPYTRYHNRQHRRLGLLKDRGGFFIRKDFKMTDEAVLES